MPLAFDVFQIKPKLEGLLTGRAISCSSIEIIWDAVQVIDNTERADTRIRVLVAEAGAPFDAESLALEATASEDRAIVDGLAASTTYRVAIAAVDVVGNVSELSASIVVETPPANRCDVLAPTFLGVESLTVDPESPQTINASWSPATDDETPPADLRYRVYVAFDPADFDFQTAAATTSVGATSVAIEGLDADAVHFVVVRAVDATGNEDANEIALSVRTPASWSRNVTPILAQPAPLGGGCTQSFCHSQQTRAGGLDLTTHAGVLAGGNTPAPPVVAPGDSIGSLLLWRTDESNSNFLSGRSRMPLGSPDPLTEAQLDTIKRWIDQGAFEN